MSTDAANPNVTTTTTTTASPPPANTITPKEKENVMQLTVFLDLLKSYGLPTAFCIYFIFGWMEPMKEGHLKFLTTTGDAVQTQADTIKTFGETNAKISNGIEKVSIAVESASKVATEANATNVLMLGKANEHFEISKQTQEDVKAIKSAVIDHPLATPSGTKKKP